MALGDIQVVGVRPQYNQVQFQIRGVTGREYLYNPNVRREGLHAAHGGSRAKWQRRNTGAGNRWVATGWHELSDALGSTEEWWERVMLFHINPNVPIGRPPPEGGGPTTNPPPVEDDDDMEDFVMNGHEEFPRPDGGPIADPVGLPAVIAVSSMSVALRPIVANWLRSGGFSLGQRISWANLPTALKGLLTGLGIERAVDILWDWDGEGSDSGLIPFNIFGSGSDDPTTAMVEAMTVSTWEANGQTFHRLSDGRQAVRKKSGVWTIWRPKKPTVLFSTGAADIKDLLKAEKIITKQLKSLKKAMKSRKMI